MHDLLSAGRGAYNTLVGASLRRRLSPALFEIGFGLYADSLARRLAGRRAESGPIVVSGLMSRQSGIGRAGRLTVGALEAAGHQVVRHDAEEALLSRVGERLSFPVAERGGVWICHMNAPEAAKLFCCFRFEEFASRWRVGYWAYELQPAPKSWARTARLFDEIWVPSRFTAEAVRAVAPDVMIKVVQHPTADVSQTRSSRADFGLPEGSTIFFSLFDMLSSSVRKNPFGAIQAYKAAFPEPRSDALLVVKAMKPEANPDMFQRLKDKARRSDIRLITDQYSDQETLNLLASIDVLISLHRAEGFGLSLLEAMALGKAVVATNWSGNLEFMTPDNSLLVDYNLVPVRDPGGVYAGRDRVWADPDIPDAARQITRLYEDAQLRSDIARNAKNAVLKNTGGESVAAAMRESLERARQRGASIKRNSSS